PVVSISAADHAAATLSETDTALTASGTVTALDPDLADSLLASVSSVSITGTGAASLPAALTDNDNAALTAFLSLSPTSLSADAGSTSNLAWSFDSSPENFDFLASGETLTLTYTITVADSSPTAATAQQLITIAITGTNDAPIVAAITSVKTEDDAAYSLSLGSDPDTTDVITISGESISAIDGNGNAIPVPAGSVTINGSTLSVNPNAFNSLAVGESAVITITYDISDSSESRSNTATVTITGANDAPVISFANGNDSGALQEDTTLTASGTLTSSDSDNNATATWSIQGNANGTYGTLELGVNSGGSWTYTLNNNAAAVQSLAIDQSVSESFTVRVTDDQGATAEQLITIVITGSNDTPVVTNSSDELIGTVIESGNLDDGTAVSGVATTSGTLTATDADANATQTWSIEGQSSNDYGSITINASTGDWTYSLNNDSAATQALKEGESIEQVFIARVADDQGAWADQTITITLEGTNDSPFITNSASALLGLAIEAGNEDDGTIIPGISIVSGSLSAIDQDADATQTWSIQGDSSTDYGSISINPQNGEWTYTLDNTSSASQALREGDSTQQSFIARVTDDQGAWVDQLIIITIQGTNDSPTVIQDAIKITAAGGSDSIVSFNLNDDKIEGSGATPNEDVTITFVGSNASGVDSAPISPLTTKADSSGDFSIQLSTEQINRLAEFNNLRAIAYQTISGISSGRILSTDPDADSSATYSLLGESIPGLTFNSDGTWSFDSTDPTYIGLSEGETFTISISYRVTDDFDAYTDESFTLVVTGSNDRPTLSLSESDGRTADLAAGGTDLSATGTITAIDPDQNDVLSSSVASVVVSGDVSEGQIFSLSNSQLISFLSVSPDPITSSQKLIWEFSAPKDSFASLADGEEITLAYTIQVSDGINRAVAEEVIEIRISGTNNEPIATYTASQSTIEAGTILSGQLTAEDPDITDTFSFELLGDSIAGFTLNTDGSWTFNPSAADYRSLAENQPRTITVDYRVTDGSGGTDDNSFTIHLTGINNAPSITILSTDVATASLVTGDTVLSATGTLTAADSDENDLLKPSVSSVDLSGDGAQTVAGSVSEAQLLSLLTVTQQGGSPSNLTWNFLADAEAFESLEFGQQVVIEYTVLVEDNSLNPGRAEERITLIITGGNNNAPIPSPYPDQTATEAGA
ncbi:MAG: hypothetical protein EBS77_08605, partial [Gammaproteobacteria bacterium]|nr:hypothetical protein [Gammaproteobacteria bacterium]